VSDRALDLAKPDPKINDVLIAIEQLDLDVVQGRQFKNETVYLDGREFRDCSFESCKIFIKLGVFRLTGSVKMIGSTFVMDGPANAVKIFVDLVYQQQGLPSG